METTYQFKNVQVIIDNSNQEERKKRLERAVIKFFKDVERERHEKQTIKHN